MSEFPVGSEVMCSYYDVPYLAKVIGIRDAGSPNGSYVIHYMGWSNKYDEIINFEDVPLRLKKATDEAKAEAKQTQIALKMEKTAKQTKQKKTSVQKSENSAAKKQKVEKRTREGTFKSAKPTSSITVKEEVFENEIVIELPIELRRILVDDQELMKNKFITVLPAKHTVQSIIQDFINENGATASVTNHKKNKLSLTSTTLSESPIIVYFNAFLTHFHEIQLVSDSIRSSRSDEDLILSKFHGEISVYRSVTVVALILVVARCLVFLAEPSKTCSQQSLMYKIERLQLREYTQKISPRKLIPSEHYGGQHLLRFLTKMPFIVSTSFSGDRESQEFVANLTRDFMNWLNTNRSRYFADERDYYSASLDYIRESDH